MNANINIGDLIAQLRDLDMREPGRWPFAVRAAAVAGAYVVLSLLLIYLLVWQSQIPLLHSREQQEQQLRSEFQVKHARAANLNIYRQQLADIKTSFGALLRQLPSKTQVPNLLVDISQTGLAAALQQRLFQPGPEIKKDFYAELPIKISLTGSYHEFGEFVSGIAALPRIVTLHNISIKPARGSHGYDDLEMDLTAMTYRYLDPAEVAAQQAAARKAEMAHRRGH